MLSGCETMRSSFYRTKLIAFGAREKWDSLGKTPRRCGSLWNVGRGRAGILGNAALLIVFQRTVPSWTDLGGRVSVQLRGHRWPPALVLWLSIGALSCQDRSATVLSATSEPRLGDAAGSRSQREPRLGGEKGDPGQSLQGTSRWSTPTSVLHLEKSINPFQNQTQKCQCHDLNFLWPFFLAEKAMVLTEDCKTPLMKMSDYRNYWSINELIEECIPSISNFSSKFKFCSHTAFAGPSLAFTVIDSFEELVKARNSLPRNVQVDTVLHITSEGP